MSQKLTTQQPSQAGIASILVTMILMVVLSLIVLGFSTVSRREQTDALNSQLGTQAFYASETGINDAWANMNQQLATTGQIKQKTTCGADSTPGSPYQNMTGDIDNATNVKYTCLLINSVLPNIKVDVKSGKTFPIHLVTRTGADVTDNDSFNFSWYPTTGPVSGPSPAAGCSSGPDTVDTLPTSSTCKFATLEVELVPTNPAGLSRDILTNKEFTTYLVPTTGGGTGTVDYSGCNPATPGLSCGQLVAAGCSSGTCNATITGLANLTSAYYQLRIKALYDTATVIISPASSSTLIAGAEAQVDSTGQANDVLRRTQVRFSMADNNLTPLPTAGLQTTQSICKRYEVAPGVFRVGAGVPAAVAADCGTTNPPGATDANIAQCIGPNQPSYCNNSGGNNNATEHPGQPRIFFNVTLYNVSQNPGQTVIGCIWTWGDPRDGSRNVINDQACGTGESLSHCYQVALALDQPENVTVTLQLFFLNAPPSTPAQYPVAIPHSPTTLYSSNPQCSLPV